LNPYIWQKEQRDLEAVFAGIKPSTVQLTKSYRSTEEIFHFCDGILQSKSNVATVIRTGPKPIVTKVTAEKSATTLHGQIKQYLKAGHKTIAVICPSLTQCKENDEQLLTLDQDLKIAFLD